jgi:hypothetical protein
MNAIAWLAVSICDHIRIPHQKCSIILQSLEITEFTLWHQQSANNSNNNIIVPEMFVTSNISFRLYWDDNI